MDPYMWHKIAAVSGVAALGLGTYGAHGFKPKNPTYKEVWHTASLYHLVHTAALVASPITKRPHIFGGLLTAGIVAFSGTCYTVAYLEDRKYSKPSYYYVWKIKLKFLSHSTPKGVLQLAFESDFVEDFVTDGQKSGCSTAVCHCKGCRFHFDQVFVVN
ncbi:unnamed protein product [Cuscuta epithymum]|uniref:Transmembrane protein 256 homolog n=1 Tax=Cuscuta epithymum TaxID=186058 RepID=A0AAV0DLV6_9ASTE|nr:unnamed protein product [Cuscuta epithymum]